MGALSRWIAGWHSQATRHLQGGSVPRSGDTPVGPPRTAGDDRLRHSRRRRLRRKCRRRRLNRKCRAVVGGGGTDRPAPASPLTQPRTQTRPAGVTGAAERAAIELRATDNCATVGRQGRTSAQWTRHVPGPAPSARLRPRPGGCRMKIRMKDPAGSRARTRAWHTTSNRRSLDFPRLAAGVCAATAVTSRRLRRWLRRPAAVRAPWVVDRCAGTALPSRRPGRLACRRNAEPWR